MTDTSPRLQFKNESGNIVTEYFPIANSKFGDWLRELNIDIRTAFGKDIYYWHTRHYHDPEFRKLFDLQFVQHVIFDHEDQEPEDPVEKRHYKRAWKLYGHEIKYVLSEIGKDRENMFDDGPTSQGHPYAYAYAKKWLSILAETEQKLKYHGLSFEEHRELAKLSLERATQKRSENNQQSSIDPETPEPPTTNI